VLERPASRAAELRRARRREQKRRERQRERNGIEVFALPLPSAELIAFLRRHEWLTGPDETKPAIIDALRRHILDEMGN
jgi:hypothetical protein